MISSLPSFPTKCFYIHLISPLNSFHTPISSKFILMSPFHFLLVAEVITRVSFVFQSAKYYNCKLCAYVSKLFTNTFTDFHESREDYNLVSQCVHSHYHELFRLRLTACFLAQLDSLSRLLVSRLPSSHWYVFQRLLCFQSLYML